LRAWNDRMNLPVLVMVMIRMAMMVMVAVASQVDMIRLAAQTAQQEPDTQASNDQAAPQAKRHLEVVLGRVRHSAIWEVESQRNGNGDDHAGVRQRGYQAEEKRVRHGAALANEVGGHERLAVS